MLPVPSQSAALLLIKCFEPWHPPLQTFRRKIERQMIKSAGVQQSGLKLRPHWEWCVLLVVETGPFHASWKEVRAVLKFLSMAGLYEVAILWTNPALHRVFPINTLQLWTLALRSQAYPYGEFCSVSVYCKCLYFEIHTCSAMADKEREGWD